MLEDALEKRFAQLEELAQQYAQARADAEHIREFRKSKKAILMRDAEKAGHRSAATQEREAYANVEYMDLLDALRDAVHAESLSRWRLELARMRFEAWRSKQATRRTEMGLR